jgi:ParB family chromosome partitioning protein
MSKEQDKLQSQLKRKIMPDFNAVDIVGKNTPINTIKMIPVQNILPNPENFYSITNIDELAESIEAQGLLSSPTVTPTDDGKYLTVSGHRRMAAVKKLIDENRITETEVPCKVMKFQSDNDMMIALILSNATTREISDGERLQQYRRLKQVFEQEKIETKANGGKYGKIRQKIADVLKVSNTQVARYETIERHAVDEVKKAVDTGELSLPTASELSKLSKEEQLEIVTKKPLSNITYTEIKEKAENRNTKKVSKLDTFSNEQEIEIADEKKVSNLDTFFEEDKSNEESEEKSVQLNTFSEALNKVKQYLERHNDEFKNYLQNIVGCTETEAETIYDTFMKGGI